MFDGCGGSLTSLKIPVSCLQNDSFESSDGTSQERLFALPVLAPRIQPQGETDAYQGVFSLHRTGLTVDPLQDPAIATLIELYKSLDTCFFQEVWDFLKIEKDLLKCKVLVDGPDGSPTHVPVEIVGWVDSIRQYIAHVITATYQVVDVKVASAMLGGLAGAELKAFAEKQGWQVRDCSAVVVFAVFRLNLLLWVDG